MGSGKERPGFAMIISQPDNEPSELELGVAECMFRLRLVGDETASMVRQIQFYSVELIEHEDEKAAIVLVPVPQLRLYQKLYTPLTTALKREFPSTVFVFTAKRTEIARNKITVPHRHTHKAVCEGILGDIVYPASVIGHVTRFALNQRPLESYVLSQNAEDVLGEYLGALSKIFKRLTNKNAVFSLPDPAVGGIATM